MDTGSDLSPWVAAGSNLLRRTAESAINGGLQYRQQLGAFRRIVSTLKLGRAQSVSRKRKIELSLSLSLYLLPPLPCSRGGKRVILASTYRGAAQVTSRGVVLAILSSDLDTQQTLPYALTPISASVLPSRLKTRKIAAKARWTHL